MTTIKIKKGAGTPSGLTFGELAYDLTNKKLFIGITGGNALLANTDGGVASFNGITGAVTGVTLGGAAFTGLVSSTVGFSGAGTNLTGNASGLTAGTATRVITTSTSSASTFYPTFVSGAGNTALFIDSVVGPLSYIPLTATLKLSNLDLGAGALTINSFEVTASNYFYFIASNGIYFQDPTRITMGDVGLVAGKTLFEVYPAIGSRYACLYNYDFANNATLMVNRLSPVGTHAFEVNRSDGKAAKLIYGDTGGTASNYVDLDVSSAGNLTITPSGSLVTITGRLDVSAGISAASGVTFSGNVAMTSTSSHTGLASFAGGLSAAGGITFASPITSTRMARHTSAAISAVQTASFSPTVAQDGTVFYIDYGGKGMNVTLEGLPIGWRAKFLNTNSGSVTFTSTTGSVNGYGALNGLSEFMQEAICIATNTYFIG